ncbi:MAG: MFS transporter [Synergistales bacterium]|nr:MFS transporter [Synergistales bacterium]
MKDRAAFLKNTSTQIGIICLMHFLTDIHLAFLPTFVPMLVQKLGISLAMAGMLNSVSGIILMFGQPLAAYFSDRTPYPWYLMAGPVLACIGATLIPSSSSYLGALTFVSLWAVGTAVYHPQGSGGIGHLCRGSNLSSYLSLFGLGGILAGSFSPLYAVFLVNLFPLKTLPLVGLVPVLGGAALVYISISRLQEDHEVIRHPGGLLLNFWVVFRKVYPIWMVAFLRALSGQGLRFFLPLVIASRGGSLLEIGGVLFLITIGAAVSPLFCGRMADLFGNRKILILILSILPFFLVPAVYASGIRFILLYFIGYALLTATEPITNAMAQKACPESRSMASSIVLGFAFGFGALFTSPLGALADAWGLQWAMLVVAIVPALSLLVILFKKDLG